MLQLNIKKADGSHHWTEHFNSKDALEKWLEEEKTRDYWKKEFKHEVVDLSPKVSAKEKVAQKERADKLLAMQQSLKDYAAKGSDLTAAEVKDAVAKMLKLMHGVDEPIESEK